MELAKQNIDYDKIFKKIDHNLKNYVFKGKVANYIPELGNIDPHKFGVALTKLDGKEYLIGDANERFSIQSIAKVFSLSMAFNIMDDNLWNRVGVEPSGTSFNGLILLEQDKGIPRNPLLNAGALVVCDILISHFKNPKAELLDFIRNITHNPTINFSERIAESEKSTSFKNAASINLMKAYNNIVNPIDEVLDFYFYLCSIEMSCKEIARSFLYLTHDGVDPITNRQILTENQSKRVNAIMQTCGFYDEAGDFAFKVGLPGKSGVGGGIVAILPDSYSIAVWSPPLNEKGNSEKGMKFLELFTRETKNTIF